MTRIVLSVAGVIGAACLAAVLLRMPARAADEACAPPACAAPLPLASSRAVTGARRPVVAMPKDGAQEWIVELGTRTYFDASCAAAAELAPAATMRMRFERTLIDLGYRRSDEPGC